MLIASLSRRGIRSAILASGSGAPVNTSIPTIDNTSPKSGDTLNGSDGVWTGSPTFTYQWFSGGVQRPETNNTYSVQDIDAGNAIVFKVIGTNAGGSTPAQSGATTVVLPVNTVAPTITSNGDIYNPVVGDVLTFSDAGNWFGADAFSRVWGYPGSGSFDPLVPPSTGITYTIASSDIGFFIGLQLTGTNAGGGTNAVSNQTGTVS